MSDSPADKVVLGLGGAWGFAPGDLTSPALAASSGAFTDSTLPPCALDFTELRVHGVSGSSGPVMLEHPAALQVAGDATTMFYRRWTPAGAGAAGVPWKLEAYSWGGLTESPLASASWLLFAPFMLYNVAHFALPPQQAYVIEPLREPAGPSAASSGESRRMGDKDDGADTAGVPAQLLERDAWHASSAALLRLLAFSASLQFTAVIVAILVSSAGLQAPHAHFPSWLSWYPHLPVSGRVALAMAGVAAVIALVWLISVRTAHRYEARTSYARPVVEQRWPLTQTRFWKGEDLVRRHRSLHAGGALAAAALIVSRPALHMGGGRLAVLAAAAVLLALMAVTLCLPLADRHNVTLADRAARAGAAPGAATRGTLWCRLLLAGGAVAFAGALFTGGWPAEDRKHHLTLPGFTNACAFLLAAQALLLVVLALVVWQLARSAPDQGADRQPFAAGHMTSVLAVLAVCLGGAFSAVIVLFVTRVLGTPVPSGISFRPPLANAVQIPWPIYAFAAAPAGLLIGVIISAVLVGMTWRRRARQFAAAGPGRRSQVAEFYGTSFGDADADGYQGCRKRIARAWAVGRLADQAGAMAVCAAAGMLAATIGAEIYTALASGHTILDQKLHGFAAMESLVGLLAAGVLVGLLRSDYSDTSRRKTIGAIWDVATFWPRAAHPFAPPCYAERAVPELVDRIRILTGTVPEDDTDPAWRQIEAHDRNAAQSPHLSLPAGPVLLTGYSQGSIIAQAVVAQLPDDTRRLTGLLTLACPARCLYGRAFPAYFGERPLTTLARLLCGDESARPAARWKNLVRPTDYIGSWVFKDPKPGPPAPARVQEGVDQPCWDPVTVTADIDPTPPPIHYHSGFWPDPRVTQLGKHLGNLIPRPGPRRDQPDVPSPASYDAESQPAKTGRDL